MFIQVSDPTADQSLSNLKDHLERACHLTYFTPRSYLSNGGRPKQEHYDQEARVQNLKTWVRETLIWPNRRIEFHDKVIQSERYAEYNFNLPQDQRSQRDKADKADSETSS